ncbi:MAG: amino acid adenylation domain-containing protein, partial [Acidobacteria bacterium]|nr:amino acid adenylation domain-containing protein [Acidobacteriota bacterium]
MSSQTVTLSDNFDGPGFEPASLVELLRGRAARTPDRLAYTFLLDGEEEEASLTYGELDRRVRGVAARLQAEGAEGQRILLLYQPGLEFIVGFFGCLYAGAVAVPTYPPRQNRSLLRLQSIIADAQARFVLTTSAILARIEAVPEQVAALKRLCFVATDALAPEVADGWRAPRVDGETLAFLQYTSGSTAAPKGVMVTHGNLLHNERMIREGCGHDEHSTFVGWLPLYHDMGLIGNVLQPLYLGSRCVLMSPVAFLQRPARWLQAISRYRARTSGGPNFAYNLCVRKVTPEERAALDLSSWTTAFNGAEPVRRETMEEFAAAFAGCGFRPEVFYPCYGLAEATLIVSGGAPHETFVSCDVRASELERNRVVVEEAGAPGARPLVGSGRALLDQRVRIADPETFERLGDDEVGEIWVQGPSVARGYWNRPEETEKTFGARLKGSGEGPFLRTGDLGFLRAGELYVTGRLKDLIIIRGRNHYPQDIELTVERSHVALRPGCGAAFSIDEGGDERLVVVQEVDHRRAFDAAEVAERVRQAVAEEHEVQVHAVALIKTGSIPKTSSGKIQRHACRAAFLAQSLDAVGGWQAAEPSSATAAGTCAAPGAARPSTFEGVVAWLAALLASKLGVAAETIDPHCPLSRYSIDSLLAVELAHAIETGLSVSLPMVSFLNETSVAQLAAEISVRPKDAEDAPAVAPKGTGAEGTAGASALSRGQKGLWFLHGVAPDSPAYNISSAVRVAGGLDVAALRRAFQKLVDRHESLRTTFTSEMGEPVRRVSPAAEVSFEARDASALCEAELSARLSEEAHRPFDLEAGPLLRVHVFGRGAEGHVLLLVMHHIVADFWSVGVLLRELAALYGAELSGASAPLDAPAATFDEYVRRQEALMASAEGERLWSYWGERLSGELPALNLPFKGQRPAAQTFCGASQTLRVGPELTRALKELGRAHGATLYMVLLAAFETLLYRYTGQEDILVGSPTTGRARNEWSDLVGYFVNPVVLRSNPSAGASFEEFLSGVRQDVLAAFAHQDFPFATLVERLQPVRDNSRPPLFQVMFVLQKAGRREEEGLALFALGEGGARLDLGALSLESVALEQRVSQFDLTLNVAEAEGSLFGSLQYNTDLFDAATVRRMAANLETLLAAAAQAPALKLSELPLLAAAEREQVLCGWNSTRRDYPTGKCLHQFFEEQAARTPDRIALIHGDERLSYRELNERANRLAHHLRTLGLTPESRVGVMLERTPDLLVSLLAVLKAGGAYVPLDPTYPRDRLAFMLEDAAAAALITGESLLGLLPAHAAQVVNLDAWRAQAAILPPTNPPCVAGAQNLAYLIYTSGSTGRPKAVAIAHSSAATFLHWAAESFTADELAGVLASTSVCFDLSVFELFAPLAVGGSVILADNALALPALPAASAVTLINTVPSAMTELVRQRAVPEGVRVVNLAGEALKRSLVESIYDVSTVHRVVNLYGPSEDTTYSTFTEVLPGEEVTIGRPLANTRAYVVDSALRPAPVGVPGELLLGGEGLARGYLNRAALTAERFIPDSFSGEVGARLYRTGDLVRWLADGRIDFLGRLDHQVKVRGFRIELGEIEAALLKHETVAEAVVVAREAGAGDVRLVAYLSGGGHVPPVTELRAYLKELLPEYMIPVTWVVLERLPLTPNGKVDRKALPAPEASRPGDSDGYVAPRTPAEELLCAVWSELLGVERVGVEDNFFELGGHSLLVTQVVSRVRQVFEVELPLRSLFESPTVAELSARVGAAAADGLSAPPPLVKFEREGPVPLSFAQQRLWFLDRLEPGSAAYNIPAAVRLTGRLDVAALERSLKEIVRRHETLRTTFAEMDGEPAQLIREAAEIALSVVDLTHLPEQELEGEAARMAQAEARAPFDLSAGPLLRATLLQLGGERHQLLVTMHHIVSDAWSVGVLLRELADCYRAYAGGAATCLNELPIQYADFALWQRGWLRGEVVERQLEYWMEQLRDAPAVLELPADRPRPAVQTYNGSFETHLIRKELADSLKALARREGVTLFMATLAAFKVLLHRYTRQEDILVGTPIANRTRGETEGLIGFFVNTLVMRTRLGGDPTFRGLLSQVRETALAAYNYQDLPFERLVEALRPERNLSHSPLFQVMFALQNAPAATPALDGLEVDAREVETGTAKFDLNLSLTDGEEGLTAKFEYNTDLFDAATVRRMAANFETLLAAAAENPDCRVAELPLLAKAEHEQLRQWNATRRDYPTGKCLHQFFEEQAARTPDRIALIYGDARLSYRELNERANRLAHYLLALGLTPESRVGVMLERTPDLLVSLLAVLKAGAAYLPLDPAYPRDRLAFMLEDAGALLLTSRALSEGVTAAAADIIRLEEIEEEVSRGPAVNPVCAAGAQNLAYLIYTSGSTGRPKAVAITHSSAATFLHWAAESFSADELCGVLASTSVCFDLSVFELFAPLSVGGSVVLADNALALPTLPAAARVTLINTVPSAMTELVRQRAVPEGVRVVNLAGEALKRSLVESIYETGTVGKVVNLYGPSEDTTYSTFTEVLPGEEVTIGRPLANTRAYVVDSALRPAPVGVPGELLLGGDGLARGYLNRPALTAERFIPDPFSGVAGARLYRTGDLVRWLADGRIDFLGRFDHQVKVRGFRIELGEIEAALLRHPSVAEAVVVAREAGAGDVRLVAYLSGGGEQVANVSELRSYLKESLPEHMIPSLFVVLERLPLTPNGKVDRKALPAPEASRPARGESYVAPRTPAEELLCAVWSELLGVERVGVEDNFFELGGHSLLVTQVVSRVR